MPLPLEKLDTRRFETLVEEARALIPRAAPEWTDHNVHDPGITLVELLAWLVEADFYRLDRTPEANLRAFLRLVGVGMQRASVADAVVVLEGAAAPGAVVPASAQLASTDGTFTFQTRETLFVSPASLVALFAGTDDALVQHPVVGVPAAAFHALGPAPTPGSALWLAFDQPLASVASTLSLHVWTADPSGDRAVAERLRTEFAAAHADLVRDDPGCAARAARDWRLHHDARTVWEYSAAGATWKPLAGVVDETRALTLTGFVRASAPLDSSPFAGAGAPAELAGRYVLRCRLVAGAYDCPPTITMVAINAVSARHEQDVVDAGPPYESNGTAGQSLALAQPPVVAGSTSMVVTLDGAVDGAWSESLEWDRVGPHDRAYRLVPETGRITFGDGRVGRVPPARATIAVRYRRGGGGDGNVAPGTLTRLLTGAPLMVRQPFAALGGAPAERIERAKARAVELLAGPGRAVTLGDFETLALATPGVGVARAFALADFHPDYPSLPALGAVTVVVLPRCPDSRPMPSQAMLGEIARYLRRRRTLTTEVNVVGPCYKELAIHARLHLSGPVDRAVLAERARRALDAWLHPLRGGPDGSGWPIGRAVYRTEVMTLLGDLDGVEYVDEVELQVKSEDAARCGNAEICRHGLVTPGAHRITIVERRAR